MGSILTSEETYGHVDKEVVNSALECTWCLNESLKDEFVFFQVENNVTGKITKSQKSEGFFLSTSSSC